MPWPTTKQMPCPWEHLLGGAGSPMVQINGRYVVISNTLPSISYEDIMLIANDLFHCKLGPAMSYSSGSHEQPSGTIAPGEVVKVVHELQITIEIHPLVDATEKR
jgi:hypothetical protein